MTKITTGGITRWNPLYPSNEDVGSLEEAAREAEWEDDILKFEENRRGQ